MVVLDIVGFHLLLTNSIHLDICSGNDISRLLRAGPLFTQCAVECSSVCHFMQGISAFCLGPSHVMEMPSAENSVTQHGFIVASVWICNLVLGTCAQTP